MEVHSASAEPMQQLICVNYRKFFMHGLPVLYHLKPFFSYSNSSLSANIVNTTDCYMCTNCCYWYTVSLEQLI